MPVATVKQFCTPNALVTSDDLVEQVAQIEDLASGKLDGREFFRHNHFTDGLERLVRRGFDRLAGKVDDGAFYLTQAMGGGKTHSLIAFGLLASDPGLRHEIVPNITSGNNFGAAKVVIFNGHQNPETLLWGYLADKLGRPEAMAPFWRNGAKNPGVDEWVNVLGTEPVLILLDELPSYLQMAQGEPVGSTTLGDLTIGALERLFNALPRCPRACVVVTNLKDDVYLGRQGAASLSPVDFLKQVFANYRPDTNFNPLGKGASGIFSPGLLKLIREDERNAHGELGRLDHDPVCDCQDYDVMTGFDCVVTQQTDRRASVSVRFVNGATSTSVSFVLARIGNEWRIDDVADPQMPSLRRFLIP